MTIKQKYQKARANYMARVRRLKKAGWEVDIIPIPKKPTKASISRLEKQTAKEIRYKSKLYDIDTGEEIKEHRLAKAKEQAKKLKESKIDKFSTEVKKALKENEQERKKAEEEAKKQRNHQPYRKEVDNIEGISGDGIDIIIMNWFASINSCFAGSNRKEMIEITNALIDTPEKKKAFAKIYYEHPEYFPEPAYNTSAVINDKFTRVSDEMKSLVEEWKQIEDAEEYVGLNE